MPNRFLTAALLTCALTTIGMAADPVRDAIVKIYTYYDMPDYYNPWSTRGPMSGTGSGAVIKGRKILSNAHVVGYQTYVQVRKYGDPRRYQARVLNVSHEADLAILTVDEPGFFDGIEPLELGTLPESQDEVLVYGFPMGGDTLSITKGVISRVEHQTYTHSSISFLAGQIDAAINPGNSGGPVIKDGAIAGVVMQGIPQADNIGYMVPVNIIRHFFDDIADGVYDGFPSMGVLLQNMENPDMKRKYGMTDEQSGMLISRILPGSPADGVLEEGDILMRIAGQPIADDGTVEFRPRQRTSVSYYVQKRQVGEPVDLEILRAGEGMSVSLSLDRPLWEDWLVPYDQYDVDPSYYIYGGVVFMPLTRNLLKAWGNNWVRSAPLELVAIAASNLPEKENQEVVLILKVLPDEVNEGYHDINYWVVEKVNDTDIDNMRDLIDAIESGESGPFVTIESPQGMKLVLDRDKAVAAGPGILATYRIPEDRSRDLVFSRAEEE